MRKNKWLIVFALYHLLIIYVTLSPFQFDFSDGQIDRAIQKIDWHTYLNGSIPAGIQVDVIANILFFLPVGFILMLIFTTGRTSERLRGRYLLISILYSALLSSIIEISQLTLAVRTTALSDLITNTLGGVTGALAAVAVPGYFSAIAGSDRQVLTNSFKLYNAMLALTALMLISPVILLYTLPMDVLTEGIPPMFEYALLLFLIYPFLYLTAPFDSTRSVPQNWIMFLFPLALSIYLPLPVEHVLMLMGIAVLTRYLSRKSPSVFAYTIFSGYLALLIYEFSVPFHSTIPLEEIYRVPTKLLRNLVNLLRISNLARIMAGAAVNSALLVPVGFFIRYFEEIADRKFMWWKKIVLSLVISTVLSVIYLLHSGSTGTVLVFIWFLIGISAGYLAAWYLFRNSRQLAD
jgi:glycopeptide antibiotics resistance protein